MYPLTGTVSRSGILALALLLAQPFVGSAAMSQSYAFQCSLTGKAEDGLDKTVCAEMAAALAHAYPQDGFAAADAAASVSIVIRNATRRGVGLSLTWTSADGRRVEGEILSVSMMDRDLDSGRRASLYRRVIAATPKPE